MIRDAEYRRSGLRMPMPKLLRQLFDDDGGTGLGFCDAIGLANDNINTIGIIGRFVAV